jgi:hypothetical protein
MLKKKKGRQIMADFPDPIGKGWAWLKDGKKGKYMSWSITFPVNGSVPITVSGVAFRNEKKEEGSKQPDYNFIVNGWKYPNGSDQKPK